MWYLIWPHLYRHWWRWSLYWWFWDVSDWARRRRGVWLAGWPATTGRTRCMCIIIMPYQYAKYYKVCTVLMTIKTVPRDHRICSYHHMDLPTSTRVCLPNFKWVVVSAARLNPAVMYIWTPSAWDSQHCGLPRPWPHDLPWEKTRQNSTWRGQL